MRFAIYSAPPPPLWDIGSSWLGYDALAARAVARVPIPGISREYLDSLTRIPGHYGLHATIKAPFRLAENRSEKELRSSIADLASQFRHFYTPPLRLCLIDNFFCLCPEKRSLDLNNLAAQCVQSLDMFRAPFDRNELTRRTTGKLTEDEKRNLFLWGYPYVMDQYRFHITLTGRVRDKSEQDKVRTLMLEYFSMVIGRPMLMDGISLFIEPSPQQAFRLSCHYPFTS